MTDDNVVPFPGETLNDLPPDRILEAAVGKLESVLVVGVTRDKEFYLAASSGDLFQNHYFLSLATRELLDLS